MLPYSVVSLLVARDVVDNILTVFYMEVTVMEGSLSV